MNDALKHWELSGCSRHKLAQKAAEMEVPVLRAIELRIRRIKAELVQWSDTINDTDTSWAIAYPEILALLKEMDQLGMRPVDNHKGITEAMIDKARDYPISDLLEVNRYRKAVCLWHDDTRPSLVVYEKNQSVWCPVCGTFQDSIGVYMKLHGVTFPTAVRSLSK